MVLSQTREEWEKEEEVRKEKLRHAEIENKRKLESGGYGYAIYEGLDDLPGLFVLKTLIHTNGGVFPGTAIATSTSIDELRKMIPEGRFCLVRKLPGTPNDKRKHIETWV